MWTIGNIINKIKNKFIFLFIAPDKIKYSIGDIEVKFKIDKFWKFLRFYKPYHKERKLIKIMINKLKEDDIFYDIGAYLGWHTCIPAKKISNGKVIAFEPNPKSAKRLRVVLEDTNTNATVYEYALSNRKGTTKFLERNDLIHGSADMIQAKESNFDNKKYTSSYSVEMIDGDTLIRRDKLPSPTVVKIDVEGAELNVLKGLSESLRKHCRLLYCEVHSKEKLEYFGYNQKDVVNYIKELGFKVNYFCKYKGFKDTHDFDRGVIVWAFKPDLF